MTYEKTSQYLFDQLEIDIKTLSAQVTELFRLVREMESRLPSKQQSVDNTNPRSEVKNLNLPKSIGESFGTIASIGALPVSPYKAD